ncbi:thioesterase II family protein [Rhodococcus sp. NPDC058514]|uniref:thioesterase II family protein n=1 Tax=unclassified Rhodococcus (in: high G+C Gram-positive bacteria) TaxID=192944 RepID=UPI0036663846
MDGSRSFRTGWLRTLHPAEQPDRMLISFPHGGASASSLFALSKLLSSTIPVAAVQYPGRADRSTERAADSLAEIVDAVSDSLRESGLRALTLHGHCMGAIAAYEVARRLEQASDVRVERLVVSGAEAPTRIGRNAIRSDDDSVRSDMQALGGTDSRILADPELLDVYLPALRADYKAVDEYCYRAGEPLSCPITALVGNVDPRARVERVAEWEQFTTGEFDLHIFEGGHFYFIDRQEEVARLLTGLVRQGQVRHHVGDHGSRR